MKIPNLHLNLSISQRVAIWNLLGECRALAQQPEAVLKALQDQEAAKAKEWELRKHQDKLEVPLW